MKTFSKVLFGLALILIVVLMLTPLLVDPNDFKDEIRARVAADTGRELTLDGDLKLSLFPWIGVEINDASLAQPPGFGDEPFVRIRQARVRVRLPSLLRGRIELDRIQGTGLSLNLVRVEDGRANWDDLAGGAGAGHGEPTAPSVSELVQGIVREVPPGVAPQPVLMADTAVSSKADHPASAVEDVQTEDSGPTVAHSSASQAQGVAPPYGGQPAPVLAPPSDGRDSDARLALPAEARPVSPRVEPEPPQQPPSSGDPGRTTAVADSAAAAVVVGGLEFVDVRIAWDDRQAGGHLVLEGLTLSTGPWVQATPVDLHLAGDLVERDRGLNARLELDGKLSLSNDERLLTLAPFELRLEGLTKIDGLTADGRLTGGLHVEPDARRYRLADLALELTASGGPIGGQPVEIDAGADLELDLLAETVKLDGVTLNSGALRLSAEANGTGLSVAPSFQGRVALAKLDLRAWLEGHGISLPDTADPRSLTQVAFESDWRWGDGRLDLERVDAMLDRTQVSGTAAVIQSEPRGYRFDLRADDLDLDAYLPRSDHAAPSRPQPRTGSGFMPAAMPVAASSITLLPSLLLVGSAHASPESLPAAGVPGGADDLFPIDLIRGLDLEGRLRADRFRAFGLELGDLDATIEVRDGRLRLDERVGRFYQGQLQGHAILSAGEDPPDVKLVQQAVAIQIGPLLLDLAGDEVITGQGRVEVDLHAKGQTPDALKGSLAGTASVDLADGSIKGLDLERVIRRAGVQFKGGSTLAAGPERTDFTELRASATIGDGVLINKDLHATSDLVHAGGEGSLNLATERLDYLVTARLVASPDGGGIKELEGIPVPIRLTGELARPDWDVDLAPVLRDIAKRELRKELDKKGGGRLKELEERTGIKGLEQGLRQLFKF